ncbi:MAG: hypothetical protein R6U57_05535 [Anaerolineales bacterium]
MPSALIALGIAFLVRSLVEGEGDPNLKDPGRCLWKSGAERIPEA